VWHVGNYSLRLSAFALKTRKEHPNQVARMS